MVVKGEVERVCERQYYLVSTFLPLLAQQTYMLKVFHAIQMQITHSLRYTTPDRTVNFFFFGGFFCKNLSEGIDPEKR